MKFRAEVLLRDVDVAAIAFLALSEWPEEGAHQSGPVPSTGASIPSSEPSTSTGDTVPDPFNAGLPP